MQNKLSPFVPAIEVDKHARLLCLRIKEKVTVVAWRKDHKLRSQIMIVSYTTNWSVIYNHETFIVQATDVVNLALYLDSTLGANVVNIFLSAFTSLHTKLECLSE